MKFLRKNSVEASSTTVRWPEELTCDAIQIEATDWALRHERGALTLHDTRMFEQWCAADARHVEAYDRAIAALCDLASMAKMPAYDCALPPMSWWERGQLACADLSLTLPRPTMELGFATAAVAAVLAFAVSYFQASGVYQTPIGQLRTITLEDGSLVTLGADSRIEVEFHRDERSVALTKGEAFFSIAKDASRPFLVSVDETVVRVVGTKFDVHRGADEVRVAVVEGLVQVTHPESEPAVQGALAAQPLMLTAGEQIVAPRKGPAARAKLPAQVAAVAWQTGRLDYNGARLREVVADANRYYAPGIEIQHAALADLRVTASYRANQVDEMMATLRLVLPVDVKRKPDGKLIIFERP